LRERHHLEDPGVDGRIILKFVSEKSVGRAWTGFIWLRTVAIDSCCVHGDEHFSFIKCRECLDKLRNYGHLQKYSALWR
jgi:hypothetical protein